MAKRKKQEEVLYPVRYNGKDWYEKDCDGIFVAMYHTRSALNGLGGVYLSEGDWVYPDGKIEEF
jgi:hypothetical protein